MVVLLLLFKYEGFVYKHNIDCGGHPSGRLLKRRASAGSSLRRAGVQEINCDA